MNHRNADRGQALILMALAAIGLFAITGLVIDGSAKFSDRRHAQNAADTAALAAALSKATALTNGLSNSPATCPPPVGTSPSPVCDAVQLAGLDRAESNGYDNNLVSNTVEVYSPPISGYYTGNESYVQVILTSHVNTYFARIVGIDQTHNTVQAVALSKEGGPLFYGASVVSTNPNPNCSSGHGSGGGSVDVGGSGVINLSGGGIFVNSSASCGFSQPNCTGATLNISGGGISSAGSDINTCNTSIPTNELQQQIVVPDEIYMPNEPIECSQTASATNMPLGSNTWYISPGYYEDFPQMGIINNRKNIIMQPGVYCVNGDVHWSGTTFDSLDGTSGVTIYLTSGHDFSMSTNSPISLNASNSGEYAGYLIILNGSSNSIQNCTINGGNYLNMNGTIFAPYCNITINGDSSTNSNFNAQVIGWDIKLNGNNTINFNYNPSDNAQNKRRVGLMR